MNQGDEEHGFSLAIRQARKNVEVFLVCFQTGERLVIHGGAMRQIILHPEGLQQISLSRQRYL
jgi:hypothetical protein